MPPATPSSNQSASWLTTLGWAAYLACSWTWCIGMFLPVLLIRDFGLWGFAVFAVPNVLGAAAMGWVLRSQEQSRTCVEQHARACRIFSGVTIAFQAYFLLWLPADAAAIGAATALFLLAAILFRRRQFPHVATGSVVWLVSAAVGLVLLLSHDTQGGQSTAPFTSDVIWLAPVCCFGFLLCPYLDLTFHHARQNLPARAAHVAFSVGFGVLFAAMIGVTFLYAPILSGSGPTISIRSVATLVRIAVLTHILLQLMYTVAVHYNRVRPPACSTALSPGDWLVPLLVATAISFVSFLVREMPPYHGLSSGEAIYRLFMSFYGLGFPAYVWLCMIPTRNEPGTQPPSRAKLSILIVSIALAAPFYWMGFIERQTWYLAPGLGIVLLARLFLSRSGSQPRPEP